MYQLYRDQPRLVLYIILANIALSVWCLAIDPVINNDGVTYLNLAQMMLNGEWAKAFETYSWPYYSILIAATAKITSLGVESSAFILNGALATSLTFAFICIVKELSNGNRRILWIAALCILFFPSITKYRSFIIRDFGYLSCYLWSLYFILRYCITLEKRQLVGWLIFAVLSCLFRFEGIVFLLIAPYFLFVFIATKTRTRWLIITTVSAVLGSICAVLAIWYINDKYAGLIQVAKIAGKDVNNVVDLFLVNTRETLGLQELTTWSYIKVVLSNTGVVLYELVRRLSIFYFLFAIYAYSRNLGFKTPLIKRIWLVYVASNLCLLIAYSVYNNYLASRYAMASALTLLILSPFVIEKILSGFQRFSMKQRSAAAFSIILITLSSIEGLDVRTQKHHIKQSGIWIKDHLASTSDVFSNDPLIVYYAGRGSNHRLNDAYTSQQLEAHVHSQHLNNFDYVAVSVSPKGYNNESVIQTLKLNHGEPEKIINGSGNRRVLVFKIQSS